MNIQVKIPRKPATRVTRTVPLSGIVPVKVVVRRYNEASSKVVERTRYVPRAEFQVWDEKQKEAERIYKLRQK